jgi:hypothetical protein
MRMIAGSILILAASVLIAASWIGTVIHQPTAAGSPEASSLMALAIALGLVGAAVAVVGFATDRHRP